MNTIELNSQNYRDYLPLDIAAFDFAFAGAMGDPGGVNIITRNSDKYYFNYKEGDLEWSQVIEIIPVISQSHLPVFGNTEDVPAGWCHISLDMGNNLLIKEEYVKPLNREWDKYLKTTKEEYPLLYGVWQEFMLKILKEGTQPEGWDVQDWLQYFEEGKRHHETHAARAEVFQSTVRLVEAGTYVSQNRKLVALSKYLNSNNINDNHFYYKEITPTQITEHYQTTYQVVNEDCLAFAHGLLQKDSKDDLCVLNLASASNPGGGVYGGAGAQEEYLFRCSDYYRFLFQYASKFDCRDYGIEPNQRYRYPLERNFGGVYSHGVTVFRDKEALGYPLIDEPWHVNFIAVAACNLSHEERGDRLPSYLVETTQNKIRTILRIAYTNGQTRLVLGALGCGAFGNPPAHIAELFHDILHEQEFSGRFREVYFAIINDHNNRQGNYEAFAKVFDS